jgi:DNA-binding transcriptional LysR family regulator
VRIRDAHSDEIVAMLLDGVVDVGFILPGSRPPALRFVPLPPDPVVCICAPSHPLAGRRVSTSALAGHRVALNVWGSSAADFLAKLRDAGSRDADITECSDAITALRLARHHGHVALVTASIALDEMASGAVIPLDLRPRPRWSVPLSLAYRVRDSGDPVLVALRAMAGGR